MTNKIVEQPVFRDVVLIVDKDSITMHHKARNEYITIHKDAIPDMLIAIIELSKTLLTNPI